MSNLKTLLRIGGIVVVFLGMIFLPIRNYVFDKGDLSAFDDVSELGGFVTTGLVIMGIGLVAIGLSFLIRGDLTD